MIGSPAQAAYGEQSQPVRRDWRDRCPIRWLTNCSMKKPATWTGSSGLGSFLGQRIGLGFRGTSPILTPMAQLQPFDSITCDAMGLAFDAAWQKLLISGTHLASPVYAKRGERDVNRRRGESGSFGSRQRRLAARPVGVARQSRRRAGGAGGSRGRIQVLPRRPRHR